jgi:hypothetical protein
MRRWRSFWTPLRIIDTALVLVIIGVVIWSLHPSLLFSSSLITGGDTGSHLVLPAYLRSQNDIFHLTPWFPGWFDGLPAYSFYFILPDIFATWGSYIIGFAVAMKLATILGSVLMPVTAYAMARLFRAPRPIPIALAFSTLPFLFDASFTIDGGNLFSTMAGEYAFSLSLALALLTVGLVARGVRTGRGYWLAAFSLSATLAAHVLPWFFAIGAIIVVVVFELFARRGIGDPTDRVPVRGDFARPVRFAVGAGILSLGLSAWWLLPFATTQNLTDSLNYQNDSTSTLHAIFTTLGWFNASGGAAGDRWVIVLCVLAIVVAISVRNHLGMVLASLSVLSFWAFVLAPQSAIWNERLIPFWYISIHLSAGWLVGYLAYRWAQRVPRRYRWTPFFSEGSNIGHVDDPVDAATDGEYEEKLAFALDVSQDSRWQFARTFRATAVVALLGLVSTLPGLIAPLANDLHLSTSGNQVSSWAQWNYAGYQAATGWPEYHNLMQTMSAVSKRYGCGRAMWEYNSSEDRFGTPEALMLLPYWTNNCVDSMEGLLMESSPTTPYHFLDQAELSVGPSEPQRGLAYEGVNVTEGVRHLQMLGVKYYMAFSPSIITQANADPNLRLVATTRAWPAPGVQWRIYLIRHSPLVVGLRHTPNVVAGIATYHGWLSDNTTWWLNAHLQSVYAAASGPPSWPTARSITTMTNSPTLPSVKVTNVDVGQESVSFHVSRVGVPVLVKISYFPNWHATGATGPYRVSPNLMVVIPTSKQVALNYTSTPAATTGDIISDLTIFAALVTAFFALKRRRERRR